MTKLNEFGIRSDVDVENSPKRKVVNENCFINLDGGSYLQKVYTYELEEIMGRMKYKYREDPASGEANSKPQLEMSPEDTRYIVKNSYVEMVNKLLDDQSAFGYMLQEI